MEILEKITPRDKAIAIKAYNAGRLENKTIIVEYLRSDCPENGFKHWDYSNRAEKLILNRCLNSFGLTGGDCTTGNDSRYDFIIEEKKIELKVTRLEDKFCIEYAYGNGEPSGISTTEADYYMWMHPGYTKNTLVGKLSLWPINTIGKQTGLKDIVNSLKSDQKHLKNYSGTPGSKNVIITHEMLKYYGVNGKHPFDLNIFDIELIKKNGRTIGFDLGHLTPCGKPGYVHDRLHKILRSNI